MGNKKPMLVRSCPVCRVAMMRIESGWECPQCGSSIILESPPPNESRAAEGVVQPAAMHA